VDELGGFPSALAAVRELLNLTPGAPLNLTLLPREKTTFEKLSSFMESSTASTAASTAAIETLRAMQPAVRSVGQVAVPPEQRGVVHAPALPDVE
jgi:hypothetical protein